MRIDLNWLWALPILLGLVAVHELGHFIVARWVGVTVLEFAIGLPPRLWSRTRGGIRYSLNALPIGGYVRLLGEDDTDQNDGSYNRANPWARAAILVAGIGANLLVAVLLLATIALLHGPMTPTGSATLLEVTPDLPVAGLGLRPGDRIITIDGQSVATLARAGTLQGLAVGVPTTMVIEQGGIRRVATLTPTQHPQTGQARIGTSFRLDHTATPVPLAEVLPVSLRQATEMLGQMLVGLGILLQALVNPSNGPPSLAGPIGLAQLTGELLERPILPSWVMLLQISAVISLNLALVNLLPVPALDGGRLVFVLIEAITGWRLRPEVEGRIHRFGLVALLGLTLLTAAGDIGRIALGNSFLGSDFPR